MEKLKMKNKGMVGSEGLWSSCTICCLFYWFSTDGKIMVRTEGRRSLISIFLFLWSPNFGKSYRHAAPILQV